MPVVVATDLQSGPPPAVEADLASFMDNLPGHAWIKDADCRYAFVNRQLARASDLEASKWLGRRHADIFPTAPPSAHADETERAVIATHRSMGGIEARLHDGKWRYFLVNRFPIVTRQATKIGGLAIDLTDRLRLEKTLVAEAREELLRYERRRLTGQISSSFAHTVNNTLNAINLRLALIKSEPGLGDEHPSLRRLTNLVRDAAATVRSLQGFSGVAERRPLAPLEIGATIREAVSAVRSHMLTDPERPERTIRLNDLPANLPLVLGLTPDVNHLFVNLFLHADAAMPPAAALRVAAQAEAQRVTVTVAGEGVNLSPRVWAGFLDPFDISRRNEEINGPDVTLSMAEAVILQLGGSLEIYQLTEGVNNFALKFGFSLAQLEMVAVQPAIPSARPARTLLLIDDDEDNLEEMKAVLELKGYSVQTASNGADGLRLLATNGKIDSVVCDLGMPRMNGWEVASEVARLRPGTPVYLVTGWADGILSDDPRRELVAAVFGKPIKLQELEKVLRGTAG